MSNISLDHGSLLWDINNEKAKLFIPAMLYVGILMLIGIMGNFMVLYFYGFKSKTSPSTSFILALSVFDLVSCFIGMPMEIADLRYFFNFESTAACKILRFITHFASISSGLTLVVIAIDRYRRICKPFERQMKTSHVKVLCTAIGGISLLFSWPAILFNNVVEVNVKNAYNVDLKGHDCTTTKEDTLQPYMFAFNSVYAVAFVMITITLAILYTFIGQQLFRHKKFRFYVARKATKTRRINVSALSEASSDESLLGPRQPTNAVFDDPPDASGSVVDLREFVTRGMPEVEHDRPTSGYTAVTGTTGITGLTDLSGKTKRGVQSIKSVTICDPSQNQVFAIEAREHIARPESGKSDSTWASYKQRPGSGSSFATFSSRPSSAALSYFSDVSKPKVRPQIKFKDDYNKMPTLRYVFTQGESPPIRLNEDIEKETQAHVEDGLTNTKDEVGATCKDIDVNEETDNGSYELKQLDEVLDSEETVQIHNEETDVLYQTHTVDTGKQQFHDLKEDVENTNTKFKQISDEDMEIQHISSFRDEPGSSLEQSNESPVQQTEPKEQDAVIKRRDDDNIRPCSGSSEGSKMSKVSIDSRSSRSNVVTPASNVTMASSIASRASTVKRFKRFLGGQFGSGKMNTDTDNVKELRMKMLDINTIKYTMVMLIITIVFVLSFLPYLSLVVWRYYNDDHEANILNNAELVTFQIGIRSIFINSALNPIIYGGFNSKFRAFFYSTFCACCITKRKRTVRSRNPRDHSDSTSGT